MIRSSALPEGELCGQVRVLNQQFPRTYRNTIIGSAFHAIAGDQPDAVARLELLTPDEAHELSTWKRPDDIELGGVALRYADATKETLVGLDEGCGYIDAQVDDAGNYVELPRLLVPARPDMYWVAGGTVFVGDIKTGEHPILGGPLSLQFVAPALALCDKHGADFFRTGIWWAREGRWEWSEQIAVDSPLAVQLWQRIRRAATNPPVPVVGAHCSGCFQRAFCPAHMLPATQLETDLAPLVKPGGLTAENALKAHLMLQALGKLLDTGKDTLKAWLQGHGAVKLEGGKVLTVDSRAGREYADVQLLKADGLTKYIKTSRPPQVVNVRKA